MISLHNAMVALYSLFISHLCYYEPIRSCQQMIYGIELIRLVKCVCVGGGGVGGGGVGGKQMESDHNYVP